jgi:hypothetical protein
MTRSRYRIFEDFRPHFCTCTIVGWLPLFTRPEAAQIVLDSWKFLIDHQRLEIYGYVILENHLHFIASSRGSLGKVIGDFKSFTARQIIDRLRDTGAKRFLDHLGLAQVPPQDRPRIPAMAAREPPRGDLQRRDDVAETGIHA